MVLQLIKIIFLLAIPTIGYSQIQEQFSTDSLFGITSPLDIDSLVLWLDASVGVLDSVGGSISNNEGVGQWQDQSGQGNHANDGSAAGQRPIWKSSGGALSLPYLQLNADSLGLPYTDDFKQPYITVFLVWYSNAGANAIIYAYMNAAGSQNSGYRMGTTGIASSVQSSVYTTALNNNAEAGNNGRWFLQTMYQSSTTAFVEADTESANVAKTTSSITYTGANSHKIGCRGALVNPVNASAIQELIVYNGWLTSSERSAIKNYLNKKYDLY